MREVMRLEALSYDAEGGVIDQYILHETDMDAWVKDRERVRGALRNNVGNTEFLGKALAVEACDAFDRMTSAPPSKPPVPKFTLVNEEGEPYAQADTIEEAMILLDACPNDSIVVTLVLP